MGRYFIQLSYNGSPFHGWQRQPNAPSVQQRLEEALAKVLGTEVPVIGAGRTDTGVHARCMYAHFDTDRLQLDPARLAYSLNTMCGHSIAVQRLFRVPDELHARFSATSRTYRYLVHFAKDPFLNGLSWQAPFQLNLEAMNEAARILYHTDDFTSFAKLHADTKTNICKVTKAVWTPSVTAIGAEAMVFEIKADRFLRNMVRAVVGTLIEVGRGRLSLDGFRNVVEAKNRCAAGNSMPAHALYLWDISYGDAPGFKSIDR